MPRHGLAGTGPDGRREIFIENKFWAGLTAQQPVEYLKRLANADGASFLVVVVPKARAASVWSELWRRLNEGGVLLTAIDPPSGFSQLVSTGLGP